MPASTGNKTPKIEGVVLAHDWLVGLRGGEWVLDRLARLFGPTDLYTLVDDGRFLTDAIAACKVITSPLQRLPGARGRGRRWYLPLMPWAVERLRVRDDARLLISTSSAVMKAIRPPAGVPHLCYCHSPARYIWEQTEEYETGRWGGLRSIGLRAIRRRFQAWDRRTANDVRGGGRVTKFIANSAHTARRIERCYGRDSIVIHPPVRTVFFTPDETVHREDWLLVVAALEPYKKTEIVIEAAQRAGWRLKVVGIGSQFESLRRLVGDSDQVQLLGRVDDATLRDLYRRARALVFPQIEDFGIIAAEAQACGCPVIAFAGGGASEIVTDSTGVFMHEQSIGAVFEAVRALSERQFSPASCAANAQRFSEARFDQAMLREAEALVRGDRLQTSP